jgi:flagellar biosynthesis/type III secretory pathway M-ring protein FliF/YscJ
LSTCGKESAESQLYFEIHKSDPDYDETRQWIVDCFSARIKADFFICAFSGIAVGLFALIMIVTFSIELIRKRLGKGEAEEEVDSDDNDEEEEEEEENDEVSTKKKTGDDVSSKKKSKTKAKDKEAKEKEKEKE